ncbi:MAG: hypothetical protein RKR03_08845 [Candidatus Competibacter sp.]|nr:hypothetical protein [Candidatus Competibacter sp.]
MNLFKNFFGSKKSFSLILIESQNNIFKRFGVARPTDAQRMRSFFYLCITGIAIINCSTNNTKRSDVIDNLMEDVKELVKPILIDSCELAIDKEDLKKVMLYLQRNYSIKEPTTINGLLAFEALYYALGRDWIESIYNNAKGPLGAMGYAAFIVAHGVFGQEKAEKNSMGILEDFYTFIKELTKTI